MLLEFKKCDIVRHLGLLDLQRTTQRAMRRTHLPIAYSNGFNPHIIMSFASALSSGIPGDAELLDVSLSSDQVTEEECLREMNRVLPPSLPVTRVRLVDDRFPKVGAALRQAEYRIVLKGGDTSKIANSVPAFLEQEEIWALRKTKKSETMVNIREMIHAFTGSYDSETDSATFVVRVSFVEAATLKPDLLLNALCAFAKAELPQCEIRRTALLGIVDGTPVPLIDM